MGFTFIKMLMSGKAILTGPMGVGDGKTVIDVNIELASRHPASLPVGVVMSCSIFRSRTRYTNFSSTRAESTNN